METEVLYDYYFSQEKHDWEISSNLKGIRPSMFKFNSYGISGHEKIDFYLINRINGQIYTEKVPHGKKPHTVKWEDNKFLCTSLSSNETHEKINFKK